MRNILRPLISGLCVVVWFAVEVELIDVACIVVVAAMTAMCFIEVIDRRNRSYGPYEILLSISFVSFAVYSHAALEKQVDQYVSDRVKNYPCNRLFLQEISAEGLWSGSEWYMTRTFNKYGANRMIIYQDYGPSAYGLLRYGFLYDDKRVVVLKNCSSPNPPQNK